MPRPPLPLGQNGKIDRTRTSSGRWVARTRFRDHDGVTRQLQRWGDTAGQAERRLRESLVTRSGQTSQRLGPDSTITLLSEVWLADIERSDRSASTQAMYRHAVARHVLPALGQVRVREATAGLVTDFLRAIADRSGPGAAKLARVALSGMLQTAVQHDAAVRNVAKNAGSVGGRKPAHEVKVLTVPQVVQLRAALARDPKAVGLVADVVDLMLGTGARIGEALGIRWSDVDLSAEVPTVVISGTVLRVQGQGLIRQPHPKTAAGRRQLALPAFAVAMLLRRRVEQEGTNAGDLVFASAVGTLVEPHNYRRSFRAALERTGLPWALGITPHTFRRSVGTVIGQADLQAAADQLGHSGTGVTSRHYVARTGQGPDARSVLDTFAS